MRAFVNAIRLLLSCSVAVMLLAVTVQTGAAQAQGRRVALIVGNSAYRNVDRLANPANDARLIADTLKGAGFTLVGNGPLLDLDKARFDRAVQEFGNALQGADVALFYYSGHGMQVEGVNWLVPVDARPASTRDLDFQMVDASLILKQMEGSGTKLNMLVLDACRNNPFAFRGVRGSQPGLAEMRAPEGTLISYATQPGNVAADGDGRNSPYSQALAAAIRQPGADVFRVFNQVGLAVKQETGGQQQPWLASSPIAGNFFFFSGPVTIQPPPAAVDADTVFWQSITNSRSPEDYQAYLRRFPRGTYAELAQRRLAGFAVPAPAPAPRGGAFDGSWSVTISCDPAREAAGYRVQFGAVVRGSILHGERGTRGTPDSLSLDGEINPDGTALLRADGLTGDATYTYGHVPQGSPVHYSLETRFDGSHGVGHRLELRPCSATFYRQ